MYLVKLCTWRLSFQGFSVSNVNSDQLGASYPFYSSKILLLRFLTSHAEKSGLFSSQRNKLTSIALRSRQGPTDYRVRAVLDPPSFYSQVVALDPHWFLTQCF